MIQSPRVSFVLFLSTPLVVALVLTACGDDEQRSPSACSSTIDCGVGEFCVAGACIQPPETCSETEPCPSFFNCLNGVCRPEICVVAMDCGSSAICHEYRCRTVCAGDGDCQPGQTCTAEGTCADPAVCDPPCGEREYCEESTLSCRERGCASDAECITTEICVGVECIEGCRTDESCGTNSICESLRCVAGCRDDTGCTAAQVCIGGQCVLGCDDDADCGSGEVCDGGACATGCRDDSTCPEGEVCRGATAVVLGVCEVAPCNDDPFEPNDSDTESTAVELEVVTDAIACPGNEDWYGATPGAGCLVVVDLAFSGTGVGMEVFAAGSSESTPVDPTDSGLEAQLYSGGAEEITVAVGGGGALPVEYGLTVTTVCGADLVCPDDDWFEDNDTQETAVEVGSGDLIAGIICEGDVDYYEVDAPAGCTLTAELSFSHADADLNPAIFGSDGTELASLVGTDNVETVSALIEAPGPTAVRVDQVGPGDAPYTVTLTVDCEGVLYCPADDSYEPNNSVAGATSGGADVSVEGILCEGDRDCFQVQASGLCLVAATLGFDSGGGGLDLVLFDSEERVLDNGRGGVDAQSVAALVDPFAGAVVCVEHDGDGVNTYALEAHTECVGCPGGDFYEPNDNYTDATEVQLERAYLGIECDTGSSDYFHFRPTSDCQLRGELVSDYEYDIELWGVGAPYTKLDENIDIGGSVSLSHAVNAGADYWFRIWPFGVEVMDWTYMFTVTCP